MEPLVAPCYNPHSATHLSHQHRPRAKAHHQAKLSHPHHRQANLGHRQASHQVTVHPRPNLTNTNLIPPHPQLLLLALKTHTTSRRPPPPLVPQPLPRRPVPHILDTRRSVVVVTASWQPATVTRAGGRGTVTRRPAPR